MESELFPLIHFNQSCKLQIFHPEVFPELQQQDVTPMKSVTDNDSFDKSVPKQDLTPLIEQMSSDDSTEQESLSHVPQEVASSTKNKESSESE